ncbi:hypothetical protein [Rhodococcus kronopolitis]|uniref:Uncharacterized protein n=1 Tax=Rhodococcus kronopolitis TaxID=1460226 RepID=A0ABV9FW19_9NOCA
MTAKVVAEDDLPARSPASTSIRSEHPAAGARGPGVSLVTTMTAPNIDKAIGNWMMVP